MSVPDLYIETDTLRKLVVISHPGGRLDLTYEEADDLAISLNRASRYLRVELNDISREDEGR